MKRKLLFITLLFTAFACGAYADIRYVTVSGDGTQDGLSWENAKPGTALQSVIDASQTGDQVWVAKGTYYPTQQLVAVVANTADADRDKAFVLKSGVAVYGNFAGTEVQLSNRVVTNTVNKTTLSGSLVPESPTCHVVVGGSLVDARFDGFTITGGSANGTGNVYIPNAPTAVQALRSQGGGLYLRAIDDVSLFTNLSFESNTATSGGGLYYYQGGGFISNIVLKSNSSSASGGAMYLYGTSGAPCTPKLTNVRFENNISTGGAGGALYVFTAAYPTLDNCNFIGNKAPTTGGSGAGAIYLNSGKTLPIVITNTRFESNFAGFAGGAIYLSSALPSFENVTFQGNRTIGTTGNSGGAIFIAGGNSPTFNSVSFIKNTAGNTGGAVSMTASATSLPKFNNCVFYRDSSLSTASTAGGGAVIIPATSLVDFVNCTFTENYAASNGGALYYVNTTTSTGKLHNSIVVGNQDNIAGTASDDVFNVGTSNVDLQYSIVQTYGTATNGNKIGVDPLFRSVDPLSGDFLRLSASPTVSPAINAGNNSLLSSSITTDLANYDRISYGNTIDMGAYEYQTIASLPVSFIAFSAKATSTGEVALLWSTASETDNDYFEIERSTDGKTFSFLTKVAGSGTVSTKTNYSVKDKAPYSGVNYYRLTQADKNGTKTILSIASADVSLVKSNALVLYPVPSIGNLTVGLAGVNGIASVKIVSLDGKTISNKNYTFIDGSTTLALDAIQNGQYLIIVNAENKTVTKSFIVAK